MANIFDYMQWRDLEITKQVEFNEIDNLILSRLSYFPLDGLFIDNEKIQLNQIYKKYKERGIVGHILQKEDLKLFPILASSIRFGNILLSDYINKIDSKLEKQFSAITIYLPDETMYVAFRGTDNTIIGWKEDFNMSFSDVVAAQEEAVKYLEIIALSGIQIDVYNDYIGGEIRLAIYHSDNTTYPVSGISFSGSYKKCLNELELSKEVIKISGYNGPKSIKLKSLSIL